MRNPDDVTSLKYDVRKLKPLFLQEDVHSITGWTESAGQTNSFSVHINDSLTNHGIIQSQWQFVAI